MSSRKRILLALACAGLTAVLLFLYTSGIKNQASAGRDEALRRYGGEIVRVCVALKTIEAGEPFSERNVGLKDWLVDLLPEGAISSTAEIFDASAASRIAANTPLTADDLQAQTLALEVPEGLCALSVPATAQSSLDGALLPGSLADIYLVGQGTAQRLCSQVQVLKVQSSSTRCSVTVAVEPSKVEALIAAAALQDLYFVLPADSRAEGQGQALASAPAQIPGSDAVLGPTEELPDETPVYGADSPAQDQQ